MARKRYHAFIDDSGDSGFDFEKSGTSSHYTLAAVLIEEDKAPEALRQFEIVRRRHFQTGEMKSSKVGGDDTRRVRILQDLRQVPFHWLAFVVHKRDIMGWRGMQYHGSFVKFISKYIHLELYRTYSQVDVVADEHGDEAFMQGLRRYLGEQLLTDMFGRYELSFGTSRSNPLLQLADFVCGTVAKDYRARSMAGPSSGLLRILADKMVALKEWPNDYPKYLVNTSRDLGIEFDQRIAEYGVRLARDYIGHHDTDLGPDVRIRVRFLDYLLYHLLNDRADRYVRTPDILSYLAYGADRKPNRLDLRYKVVGPLRDAGLLIASTTSGYKIPVSRKELADFVNHGMGLIQPIVGRLGKCRDQIRQATMNELDILDHAEYELLRRLLDADGEHDAR